MDYFEELDGNGKKPKGPPCFLDWENARLICKFLKLFYEANLRFSGSLIVTSKSYFHELWVFKMNCINCAILMVILS